MLHDLSNHLVWNPTYPEVVYSDPNWKVSPSDTRRLLLLKEAVHSLSPILDEHPCLLCEAASAVISVFTPANAAMYGAQFGAKKHFIYTLCEEHMAVPNFHALVEEFIAAGVLMELCEESETEH
jgi:hypothetical protein